MLVHARSYRHEPVALGTVEAGGVAQVCVVRGTAHLLWICLPQLTLFTGDGVQTDTPARRDCSDRPCLSLPSDPA